MADGKTGEQQAAGSGAGAGAPPPASSSGLSTAPGPQFKPGQIGGAPGVTPKQPAVETLSHIRVGFTLALIFSGILFIYLIFAVCSIWSSESRAMGKIDTLTQGLTINEIKASIGQTNAITKNDIEALTKSVSEAYRDTRATTIEFHKTVIINVLFPILTALLGYIFANREKNDPNQNGK